VASAVGLVPAGCPTQTQSPLRWASFCQTQTQCPLRWASSQQTAQPKLIVLCGQSRPSRLSDPNAEPSVVGLVLSDRNSMSHFICSVSATCLTRPKICRTGKPRKRLVVRPSEAHDQCFPIFSLAHGRCQGNPTPLILRKNIRLERGKTVCALPRKPQGSLFLHLSAALSNRTLLHRQPQTLLVSVPVAPETSRSCHRSTVQKTRRIARLLLLECACFPGMR
jgi:hypothetical protein